MGQGQARQSEDDNSNAKYLRKVGQYTAIMSKYGYNKLDMENYGVAIDLKESIFGNREKYEEWLKTFEGKEFISYFEDKTPSMETIYGYYKKCIEDDVEDGTSFDGYDDTVYRVNARKNIVDYAKRAQYEGNVVEIGQYDYKNAKYAVDMEYLRSLDEDKRENYIKYSFLRHYLYLGRLYEKKEDFKASVKNVEEFLKVKPFFNIEVPQEFYAGTGWPIQGDYSDMAKDDDYIDTKKFLEKDDDTILLCLMDDPNPDYPDYYDPEPNIMYPISRSYLKKIYNSLDESENYVGNFTSFAYRCAKDIEGFDGLFNITGNQLYLLSPYFIVTGASQEIYINARDAMSMMYSNDKVFALRKEKDIPISAGVNVLNVKHTNPFGDLLNVISADHCQGGTQKTIYRVLTAEIDEYTEVEKQVERVEALTKEQLFERYPKFKDILENPQRCKTAATLSKIELFLEKTQNQIISDDNDQIIKEIDITYERNAKLNKLKQLNMDYKAKLRAQQEIQNITVYQEQIGEVKNKCRSLLLDVTERHPEVKQILENVVTDLDIVDSDEIDKILQIIQIEYYYLLDYEDDNGEVLTDRELKTEADKQIEKSNKILKIKEIKDISPSQVNVLVDYISSHDFNAKHKLETVEEKIKENLYPLIKDYLNIKENAKRKKQESEDDNEEYITDKQYEAAMQTEVVPEKDLRKLAEGPYIPLDKYYDKVKKYMEDNLDPVLLERTYVPEEKYYKSAFVDLEDLKEESITSFEDYDYDFEYEYDKYVTNYITNVIFEYSKSDIYKSREDHLRNVDYYVYTIIKQVVKQHSSFQQVIKTFLDPDELSKVYFRYNVMVEYKDLEVIEKLLTYGGKAYLVLSSISEFIDSKYNELDLYEEILVIIQQNENADNEVILKKIQEATNKIVGEEVEIPEEDLEYIDEEVLDLKFIVDLYEPIMQEGMGYENDLEGGFDMSLLRRFHRTIRDHYRSYGADELPALSDYYQNSTIDGILSDLRDTYDLENEEELKQELEEIKRKHDRSIVNDEDFMSIIQQHYNGYEGPVEIDESIFEDDLTVKDVLNTLESSYGDLNEYDILKDSLEKLESQMEEEMEEENEPLARRLNFDDEEDLAGGLERLSLEDDEDDDSNLNEVVDKLYENLQKIQELNENEDIQMITKGEIKRKFLEYFNVIPDPNYITSELVLMIKTKYEDYWYSLTEDEKQSYADNIFNEVRKYDKFANQVQILEP